MNQPVPFTWRKPRRVQYAHTDDFDSARGYVDQRPGGGALMLSIIQAPFVSFRSQKASLI